MPRATIPYEKLKDRLLEMYPFPIYRRVRIVRRNEFKGFTPITLYDRSKGNFSPIGYKVRIDYSRFQGEYDSVMNPVFREETQVVAVLLD